MILLCIRSNNEDGISTVQLEVQPVEIGSGDLLFFKFYLIGSATLVSPISFCISDCRNP